MGEERRGEEGEGRLGERGKSGGREGGQEGGREGGTCLGMIGNGITTTRSILMTYRNIFILVTVSVCLHLLLIKSLPYYLSHSFYFCCLSFFKGAVLKSSDHIITPINPLIL